MTDPRPQFAAAAESLRSVVTDIAPDQFDLPTPASMSVRELIDHVGMAVGRVVATGNGLPLEDWPTEGFTVGGDVAAGIGALIDEATAAWADERLGEQVEMPWTVMDGAGVVATYVNEVIVHTWDLAQATGQDVSFDDNAIAVADALIRRELPDAERGPMWEMVKSQMPEGIPFDPPFGDAVAVDDDASAIARLVAWNGRQP